MSKRAYYRIIKTGKCAYCKSFFSYKHTTGNLQKYCSKTCTLAVNRDSKLATK